jgi:MFS transporter, PAT family, solute carrier family 33 (acetyl-CoA transportor), member 1
VKCEHEKKPRSAFSLFHLQEFVTSSFSFFHSALHAVVFFTFGSLQAFIFHLQMTTHRRSKSPQPTSSGKVYSDLDISEENMTDSYKDKDHEDKVNKEDISLPPRDYSRFCLLVLLYFIQGIPIGLAFGSVPFLLKSNNLSYSQVGLFSLATYPYSLKLIWSPIVDSCYNSTVGKRRSWVIPIQIVSGLSLIYLGTRIDAWITDNDHIIHNLTFLSLCFFFLILLCATQDIAVDGWALTILSKSALSYASTAQTVGLNTGYFVSFTIFLAFNSKDFMNKYFRSTPLDRGFISLGEYMIFAGLLYLAITVFIVFFIPENPPNGSVEEYNLSGGDDDDDSIKTVYYKMFNVLKLKNVQTFIILHLISKIAFQANEGATNLKLLDKGFTREDLAITVLIDFPFEIIFGYYAARWSNTGEPLKPWLYGYLGRVIAAALGQVLIYSFPKSGEITTPYFIFVILQHLLSSFMSTIQFVSICAFHTKIADPMIGGTYMTTLNTLSNLGGQWPKIIVLYLIDKFSESECVSPDDLKGSTKNPFINEEYFMCYSNDMKNMCLENGGACVPIRDGYYLTNLLCIVVGLVLYFGWIRKTAKSLESLPLGSWRVKEKGTRGGIRTHLPL